MASWSQSLSLMTSSMRSSLLKTLSVLFSLSRASTITFLASTMLFLWSNGCPKLKNLSAYQTKTRRMFQLFLRPTMCSDPQNSNKLSRLSNLTTMTTTQWNTRAASISKSKTRRTSKLLVAWLAPRAATWSASLKSVPKMHRRAWPTMWSNSDSAAKAQASRRDRDKKNPKNLYISVSALDFTTNTN